MEQGGPRLTRSSASSGYTRAVRWGMRSTTALLALVLPAALALGGCAADARTATPEGTLAALAEAVDRADDAAVARLVCPAARDDGDSMSRIHDGLVELDPAFAGAGWTAEPGPVRQVDATSAVGTLTVTRTGWPPRESPQVAEFLQGSRGPLPITLLRGDRIALVRQDDAWLACS